jgi:hypothetical protein
MKLFDKQKEKIKYSPIKLFDLRKVFFPKNFYEKYSYLGSVPWEEDDTIFKAIRPLVLLMDLKAKPWWCPRWFLRLLNLLGNDNSIVRVRSTKFSNLFGKLTKNYRFLDYKTKWAEYDLRISIAGDDELWFMVESIEEKFYNDGRENYIKKYLSEKDPNIDYRFYSLKDLEKRYEELTPKY